MKSVFTAFFYRLCDIAPITFLILTLTIIMVLLLWNSNHVFYLIIVLFGLVSSIISIIKLDGKFVNIYSLIYLDKFSYFYMFIILLTVLVISIASYFLLFLHLKEYKEFYLLMLSSTIGGIILTGVNHLLSFFICIELVTLPVFGMIGYVTFQNVLESRIKYILLSGIASSILLFGISLIYSDTGSLYFSEIGKIYKLQNIELHPLFISGLGLIIIGMSFKLSLFPFHHLIPDIYQFSPIPVSIFLSTVNKISIFISFVRFFIHIPICNKIIQSIIFIIAVISIFLGNLVALNQNNIKRILSYSSIAHTGYLLIGLIITNDPIGLESIGMYVIGYIFSNINIFFTIGIISKLKNMKDSKLSVQDCRGLFWNEPILALSITISLFSLSGVPPTIGFIGKFYILFSIIKNKFFWLPIILITNNIISLLYYLKIITNLYLSPAYKFRNYKSILLIHINKFFILCSSLSMVFLGIYPKPITMIIKSAKMVIHG